MVLGISVTFFVSFLVTVTLMIALRPVAAHLGLMDRPGGRKLHKGEVPLTGGLAMTAGMLASSVFVSPPPAAVCFASSILLLAAMGTLDDRFDLPKSARFLVQIAAALILVYGAHLKVTQVVSPFSGELVQLGAFAEIFTMLLVLTAINAFNIFDGANGIAGGQACVALTLFGAATLAAGAVALLPLIVCVLASVIGFLVFNWPARLTEPKLAFMGDAGSNTLGFVLAWLSIEISQGERAALPAVCVLWIFSLPLYDLFTSMLRRVISGRSPFSADADHLHHVLRRYFPSSMRLALVVVIAAGVLGSIGVVGHFAGVPDAVLCGGWVALGSVYYLVFGSGLIVKRRRQARVDQGA